MAGYIKLYRGWRDNIAFDDEPFSEREAWVWLIENAAWKDTNRRAGKGQIVPIKRGQIHVSRNSLAGTWGWTPKRVRGFLARLEKCEMLGLTSDTNGTVATICNYGKYQDEGPNQGQTEGQIRAKSGPTQEEGKEREEERNKGGYAFSGAVIRLKQADLDRWKSSFPMLDVPALLQSRDDWLRGQSETDRKRWFNSTSSWLAKRQQAASAEARQPTSPVIGI